MEVQLEDLPAIHQQNPETTSLSDIVAPVQNEGFSVEKILDRRIKNSKVEYLLKWRGYSKLVLYTL